MSDLLADTLRLIVRQLDELAANQAKISQRLDALATTRAPATPRAKRTDRPEHAQTILDESVERISTFWSTHRQPMHFYKFSGAFAKRWLRQTTDGRALRTALMDDPRLRWTLTEAGGTVFVPKAVWDQASPIDHMEWAKVTKSSLSAEGQSELDAARHFATSPAGEPVLTSPTAGPDPFGIEGDSPSGESPLTDGAAPSNRTSGSQT